MKKLFLGLLSLSLIFGLAACGSSSGSKDSSGGTSSSDSGSDSKAGSTAVVCFSGTGNTLDLAKQISNSLEADLFEITPEQPYTHEDLDYSSDDCRANQEMNNESARPAIATDLTALSDYDTIYIGYPIWWGTAPRIINTLLESYDLTGKDLYLFCTSGGSSIDQSISDLHALYPELTIVDGQRFAVAASEEEVEAWLANHH